MKSVIATVLVGSLVGCGGPNLSFSVRAGSGAGTVSRSALTASTGIAVSRVRLVIRKVELEKAGTTEMEEVASGPYLVDLSGANLDSATPNKVLDASFTPGTYSELEFELHKADSTDVGANADLKDMIAAGTSMMVDGTIDGAAFTFTTAVNAQQKFEGTIVLADGSNLTLKLDPSAWFISNGARLDPRDGSNRSQIENNIQTSFKAFQDDNHDGEPDA
jgi:hypothetical protein